MLTPRPPLRRYTIRSPEEADAPRSLLELHALHALGAVLDKRAWWIKWTTRPEVRANWLEEIEDALVQSMLVKVLAVWPSTGSVVGSQGLSSKLFEIVQMEEGPAKQQAIHAICEHVVYPPPQPDDGGYGAFDEGIRSYDDRSIHSDDEPSDEDEDSVLGETDEEDDTVLDQEDNVVPFDDAVAQARRMLGIDNADEDGDVIMQDEEDEEDGLRDHRRKNSFGQIAWYVAMSVFRERILALTPSDWTVDGMNAFYTSQNTRDSYRGQEIVARACSLIVAVSRAMDEEDTDSIEIVKAYIPYETREDVLKILALHFEMINEYLESSKTDISTVLDILVDSLGLTQGDDTNSPSPLGVPGSVKHTWMSDYAIPANLKTKFITEILALENVPDDQKDWHPNSDEQVLDLVHPSLFCGVLGKTLCLPKREARIPYSTAAEQMHAVMFAPETTTLSDLRGRTQFQWLPSEVDVSDKGDATIRSYINNLHPEQFANLYQSIEAIFSKFVPLFDSVLSTLDADSYSRVVEALYHQHGGAKLPCTPKLIPPGFVEATNPTLSLKGMRCQVIVKIAEIQLTPEKPSYPGGSWHIEGTDSERIIATGLYYFGSENITESRLSFRTFVHEPYYEQDDHVGIGLAFGLQNELPLIQNLGSVTAMEDRCLVFPNTYQHKVEPFELADPTKPGARKILAFFLVDLTNEPITSTAIVPPQQAEWIERARNPQLTRLPLPDTVQNHIKEMMRKGLSLDEAKEIRARLMEERSPARLNEEFSYIFSLCEH